MKRLVTMKLLDIDLEYENNIKSLNKINLQIYMSLLHSSKAYVFNLQTTSSAEAKRLWRKDIKEKWNWQCAYCGDDSNLTIDHVVPRCKGGTDFTKNVVCCCNKCNQRKGHESWEEWYFNQNFFSMNRYNKIQKWMKPDVAKDLFLYKPRRNNLT